MRKYLVIELTDAYRLKICWTTKCLNFHFSNVSKARIKVTSKSKPQFKYQHLKIRTDKLCKCFMKHIYYL